MQNLLQAIRHKKADLEKDDHEVKALMLSIPGYRQLMEELDEDENMAVDFRHYADTGLMELEGMQVHIDEDLELSFYLCV